MIPTGLSPNITGVIICRFLTGGMEIITMFKTYADCESAAFGSTGSTLVGGILADIWTSAERGWPMAL